MPYILTQEEKNQIIAEYQKNVKELNDILPEGQKVKMDLNKLNADMNNESKVRLYKKALALQERDAKIQAESHRLTEKLKGTKLNDQEYGLDRTIVYSLKPGDTEYEKAYNEAQMKWYYAAPEYNLKKHYENVLKEDPNDIFKAATSEDPENALVDYYEDHPEICGDAFNINAGLIAQKKIISPAMGKYGYSLKSTYELYGTPKSIVDSIKKDSFFTMPDINEEQFVALQANNISQKNPALLTKATDKFSYAATKSKILEPLQTLAKKFPKYMENGKVENLYSHVAYDSQQKKVVPLLDAVTKGDLDNPESSVKLAKLSLAEREEMFQITKDVEDTKYVAPEFPVPPREVQVAEMEKAALAQYAKQNKLTPFERDKLNPKEMVNRTKPGFLRSAFTRDSKEWKDFEYMYKAFNDKNNVYFQNTTELKSSADKYLARKDVHSLEDIMRLPERSQQKALLCYSISSNFENLDPIDTTPPQQQPQKEQAIVPEDIIDKDVPQNNIIKENNKNAEKEKEFEVDVEELDKTM